MRILVTNDDGLNAKGIAALVEMVRPYGELTVVAPLYPHSGKSQAITVTAPVRLKRIKEEEGLKVYATDGTPTDCVKIAMSQLFKDKAPDLIVSGINHGANSSTSVLYSGTLAAACEGLMYNIPSIGFSYCNYSKECDFSACIAMGRKVIDKLLDKGFGTDSFINVNIPNLPLAEIKGIKICRQSRGVWREEFVKRTDPQGKDYYWIAGMYINEEPQAPDTDEYALTNGYVSVVPHHLDRTNYQDMERMKEWEW